MSSSLTILTTCWPGLRAWERAASTAFSRTAAVKARTTGRATSASRRARRISVTVALTSASVRRPLPRSWLKEAVMRSERLPNTRWSFLAPSGALVGRLWADEGGTSMSVVHGDHLDCAPG